MNNLLQVCEHDRLMNAPPHCNLSSNQGDTNAPQLFIEGDVLYEAMLDDIDAARDNVRLESYIIASDRVGRAFIDSVIRRARCGVQVRMRADQAGSWTVLTRSDIDRMRTNGVRFEWSRPWSAWQPLSSNRRNHRKLLVVDNAVAYTGGFNLHDASSMRAVGQSRWRDTHARFTGEPAAAAGIVFDCYRDVPPRWMPPTTGRLWLLPNRSWACRHRLRCVLHDQLTAAHTRIWATTPYFVPDSATQRLLRNAAQRGVDVRLLVPGKSDVPITQWAARAAYSRLLASGVRIFEYFPRVLHAKTILVDSAWSTIGTANLDYRSLFVNDELNLIDESGELNAQLAEIFLCDLLDAQEVHEKPWSQRPWRRRIAETIGWSARRWL